MRIALVSQEYPPETAKGGLGTQTYFKAHGLTALGHQVHVLSRSLSQARTERDDRGVKVIRVPGLAVRAAVYTEIADWLSYSSEVAVAVAELHTRTPLDLVDFPEWAVEGAFHLLNRTAWNRLPTVIHLHGPLVMLAHTIGWPDLNSEFYRLGTALEGACVRLADAVFSSSQCSADWCARHYGLKRADIPILHTGVDTQLFAPRGIPKADRPTIIFVGKLVPNKGAELLLEAACRITREFPKLQLRLLGHGDPKFVARLQARAATNGLDSLLDIPGFVDRDDLPEHLSRAHVFAAPSQYEGGPGFVYLEAMACGLPVVACSGSGVSEVVHDGQNGLLVPPDDLDALAHALGLLLREPSQRRAMGARARQYVLSEADCRVCLKRLESFYAGVAGRKQPL